MAAPTAEEHQLLDNFRAKVAPLNLPVHLQEETFLIRWIRARDGDLDKALAMLTKHMEWRKKHDYDNILSWSPSPELAEMCPIEFLGYDDENNPVIWGPFGTWKLKEAAARDKKEFLKYWNWTIATLSLKMKGKLTRDNYPVTQFVFLLDFDQFSFSTLASVSTVDMVLSAVKTFENNHPETAKSFCGIKSSSGVEKLYSLMKPLMSSKTQAKVNIMAKEETWKPVLEAQFPKQILPVRYGGDNPIVQ